MTAILRPRPGWGAETGRIALTADWRGVPASIVSEVQQMVHRYSWGVDEHRRDVIESIFTPDAVWEGSVMDEVRVGPFVGRDAVLGWITRFWDVQKDQRRHVFSNLIVESVRGDEVIAYAIMQIFGATRAVSSYETSAFCRIVLRRAAEPGLAIERFSVGFDSPFWAPHRVEEMEPSLRELFGIDERDVPGRDAAG